MDNRLDRAWWVLGTGLGLGPILAGLDKLFNLLTNWQMYLNPLAPKLLHIQPATFMHACGRSSRDRGRNPRFSVDTRATPHTS